MTIKDPQTLITSLSQYSAEQEWFEFKENHATPEKLGVYISALSNGAILQQRTSAYIIFGIKDGTHEIVGTKFELKKATKGAEPLEFWLKKSLSPDVNFESINCEVDGKRVEVIHITPPYHAPIKFNGIAYIRIGQTTPKLSDYIEKERKIWEIVGRYKFETSVIDEGVSKEYILEKFRAKFMFEKMGTSPSDHTAVLNKLILEKMVKPNDEHGYDVSALLAILCANDFTDFPALERKSARLIVYPGTAKLHAKSDRQGLRGYCLGFDNLMSGIMSHIPSEEIIGGGVRERKYDIPEVAIKEIVANALIHQDFTINGAGPLVEVFTDRVRVTNPGSPLVEPERFIDAPSRSRNDRLTNFMRRLGYCEERGSGVDRAIDSIEKAGLRAPLFRKVGATTEVTLYGPMEFGKMSKEDRIRGCFQHCALRFEMNDSMTNSSLRERFKLKDKQYPQASRVISDSIEAGLIKPLSETQGKKNAKYIPLYA